MTQPRTFVAPDPDGRTRELLITLWPDGGMTVAARPGTFDRWGPPVEAEERP